MKTMALFSSPKSVSAPPRFLSAIWRPVAVVTALAGVLLSMGCATPGVVSSPVTTGPGVPPLPATDVEFLEARALLLLLADRQIFEPFTVNRALEASAPVREQLALALGRAGQPEGMVALATLLGDSEPTVRRAAALALGELAEAGYGGMQQALFGVLTDSDRETGRLAVEALAKVGVPLETVVERLIEAPTEEFFARLLPPLFRFSFVDSNAVSVVRWAEQGLELEDPALRAMAVYALARRARPEGAELLRGRLADEDPWVRGLAARGLGQVGERSDLERLRVLLDDAEGGPIIQALRAIRALVDAGKSAPPESYEPRLLELMRDPRPGVRMTAIEVSAAWLLDEALGARLAELATTGSQREQALALLALAEGEDPRSAPLLLRFAESADPVLRARAAEAAGLYRAVQVVERLLGDDNPGVRVAALQTLLASEDRAASVARLALHDADPAVRATALGWAVDAPQLTLEELEQSLERSQRDAMLDARLAVTRALVARAKAEPLERGTIVARLEELAADGKFLVRRQAIDGLRKLDREPPELGSADSARSTQAYREIVQRTAAPRTVDVKTDRGTIRIRLACPQAPLTCLNFLQLGSQGYYEGITFHRVVPDFVVQAGDPRGDGWGGPGYQIRDEINTLRYDRGAVGMALSGPDTGGSQFFMTLSPQPHLDGGYTIFGHIISHGGIPDSNEVMDSIEQGDRILGIAEIGGR